MLSPGSLFTDEDSGFRNTFKEKRDNRFSYILYNKNVKSMLLQFTVVVPFLIQPELDPILSCSYILA